MLIQRSYKTELDPNNAQRTLFAKHAGTARFVYNWGLAKRIGEYKLTGKSSSGIDQHKQLNALKESEFPWMYEVSKCVAQEALRNLEKAFQNFFRNCKQGKKPGFPKFKSKHRSKQSFRFSYVNGVQIGSINLPKIGWVRLKERDYIPVDAKINSVTVSEKTGRWFVSVQVEEPIAVSENQGPAIGLDLGLKSFVVGSDGSFIPSPKFLNKSLKRLKRLSRRHSRKKKGSQNRKKSAKRLVKLHYRIANQRKNFLHKTSTRLAKTKSIIVVEDLNVKGIVRNHSLARSISDAGWSEFVRQLEYKCTWNGGKLVKIGRFFPSSKTCSNCGFVKEELKLSERTYQCESCGFALDRDLNAARNILKQGTGSSPETKTSVEISNRKSLKQKLSVAKANQS